MPNNDYNCPFTRTKRNNQVRFNPPNPRAAICFQIYDDLLTMYQVSQMSEETWIKACNNLRQSIDYAKTAKERHPQPVVVSPPASVPIQ